MLSLAAVRKVAAQLFERESVITEDKLLAETLNQNLGKLNLEELKKDVASLPELVNLSEPSANPYITTREHMNHEAEILKLLLATPQTIISKEELIHKVWGYASTTSDNNVEAYISFLRKKLHTIGSFVSIVAIKKQGYKLEYNI